MSEIRSPPVVRAERPQNYTAQRVLRVLELVVLRPSSATAVAESVGIHPRTARRILSTLVLEGYIERDGGRGRSAHEYQPTVRLLSLAAALGRRLPLVQVGREAVDEIERQTDLTAYLAVPCYSDVLVVAASGARAVQPWATIPAHADAAGRVLLAVRTPWRQSVSCIERDLVFDDKEVTAILERGYALGLGAGERRGSLAVCVPAAATPIAALAVRGPGASLIADAGRLIALLDRCAGDIARRLTTGSHARETSAKRS